METISTRQDRIIHNSTEVEGVGKGRQILLPKQEVTATVWIFLSLESRSTWVHAYNWYCIVNVFFFSGMVNSLFGSKYFRSSLNEVTCKQILYSAVIQARTMKMKGKISVKINSRKKVTEMQLHHLAMIVIISKEGFVSAFFHVKSSNFLYYWTTEHSLSLH